MLFDIWAKAKQTKQKLGKSVHFSPRNEQYWFLSIRENWNCHIILKNGPIFLIFILFASFLPKYEKRFKMLLIFVCFDSFWVCRNFTYKSDFEASKTNYSWWRLFLAKILTFLKSLHENEQAKSCLFISKENVSDFKILLNVWRLTPI